MLKRKNIRSPHGLILRTFACLTALLLSFCCVLPTYAAEETLPQTLYLGGMPFGVKLHTQGVLVVGVSEVEGTNGRANPAYEAGIRRKDVILSVGGKEVNTVAEVTAQINASGGNPIDFTVKRGDQTLTFSVKAVKSKDGQFRCGLWIRDHTAGIGTVTFIVPQTKAFAGLGHGICDSETGELMPLLRGYVTEVDLIGVQKGAPGAPGELQGQFHAGKTGTLLGNTPQGVFGMYGDLPVEEPVSFPVAKRQEVKEGEATLYCTVSDTVTPYQIQISKLNSESDLKNFVVKVTDPALLQATGGIVQGMSGSPIVQNGKIIGAVTHVFVQDPTQGYGILIENMLAQMPQLLK